MMKHYQVARVVAGLLAAGSVAVAFATEAATITWADPVQQPAALQQDLTVPRLATQPPAGPASPWGRHPAATRTVRLGHEIVSSFDLGDATIPGSSFRTPVRGTLVLPNSGTHLPVVILMRQRPAGCTGGVHAYPCPTGTRELRTDLQVLDRARATARQGYAVLVPDLGPATVSASPTRPYNRGRAVQAVVARETATLAHATEGARNPLGQPLAGRVDLRRTSVQRCA